MQIRYVSQPIVTITAYYEALDFLFLDCSYKVIIACTVVTPTTVACADPDVGTGVPDPPPTEKSPKNRVC